MVNKSTTNDKNKINAKSNGKENITDKTKEKIPHRDIRIQTNFEDVQKHIGKQKMEMGRARRQNA